MSPVFVIRGRLINKGKLFPSGKEKRIRKEDKFNKILQSNYIVEQH